MYVFTHCLTSLYPPFLCLWCRKYRRLMFVLSIFEDVSRRGDMADAAELKQYLTNERNSLIHALTLVRGVAVGGLVVVWKCVLSCMYWLTVYCTATPTPYTVSTSPPTGMQIRASVMTLPCTPANYIPDLSQQFSLTRAVMCCHILHSSDKLRELFDRYETQGM